MKIQFNPWWILPLVMLVLGAAVGQWYSNINAAPPATIETAEIPTKSIVNPQRVKSASNNEPLNVVKVALPPAPPVTYKPQLTAKLVDNKVVLEQQTMVQPRTTENITEAKAPEQVPQDTLLAQRFNQVLADMEQESIEPQAVLHPQPLTRYPQWYQDLVPPLEFSEHIYSSKDNESRVRVNNQVVKEGELIDDKMRIIKIEPQQVIIQLQQRQFSLPALSRW